MSDLDTDLDIFFDSWPIVVPINSMTSRWQDWQKLSGQIILTAEKLLEPDELSKT